MKTQRTIGTIAIIGGCALIAISMYIGGQVTEGKTQIRSGEQKLKRVDTLFSLSPTTQPLGNKITSSGNKKIAAGKEKVSYYEAMANKLKIGGLVLIGIGAGLFFISRKKS